MAAQEHGDYIWGSVEDTLSEIYRDLTSEDEEVREEADDREHQFALGVSEKKYLEIQLSANGPGEKLLVVVDPADGQISEITYHQSSWGRVEREQVERHTDIWRFADSIVEKHFC